MNLFVGNLSTEVNDDDLRKAFEEYGQVSSAKIIKDHYSGDSRGFGFVEMPSNDDALEAIRQLNGQDIKGGKLVVSEARPRKNNNRSRRTGGGGRRW
jgi:RNA recognition motif-containing protein